MKITAITPTCDRPVAFALAERYVARQTRLPDEWIVADGGATPVRCTMDQKHVHEARPPGALNFGGNLLTAIAHATGDLVVIVEDDDWLRPDHISRLAALADYFPIVGAEAVQRYHNLASRCWRTFNNVGASLCQTGIRRDLFPLFERIVREQMQKGRFGVDTTLWRAVPRTQWGLVGQMTVVGIKGLPGLAGLGVGHRPAGPLWVPDPELAQLRAWIGSDADVYEAMTVKRAA